MCNHALMLAIHETAHGMAFGTSHPSANKIFGMFANLPIGFPMSVSFKKYHLEHHRYQGDDILDTDIPSSFEVLFFRNAALKSLWCFLQPLFYTIRPLLVNPKPFENFEILNVLIQILFNTFIVSTLGYHILLYMIAGSLLAMGLHPVAGHFISEHTILFNTASHSANKSTTKSALLKKASTDKLMLKEPTDKTTMEQSIDGVCKERNPVSSSIDSPLNKKDKTEQVALDNTSKTSTKINAGDNQKVLDYNILKTAVDSEGKFLVPETCSYYGPLNWLTFNVGYHVEHHDFPSIPGSRLPELSKIAPEFYLTLNYHTSWTKVLWQYITDPNVGPFSRVRRPHSHKNLLCSNY